MTHAEADPAADTSMNEHGMYVYDTITSTYSFAKKQAGRQCGGAVD